MHSAVMKQDAVFHPMAFYAWLFFPLFHKTLMPVCFFKKAEFQNPPLLMSLVFFPHHTCIPTDKDLDEKES